MSYQTNCLCASILELFKFFQFFSLCVTFTTSTFLQYMFRVNETSSIKAVSEFLIGSMYRQGFWAKYVLLVTLELSIHVLSKCQVFQRKKLTYLYEYDIRYRDNQQQ